MINCHIVQKGKEMKRSCQRFSVWWSLYTFFRKSELLGSLKSGPFCIITTGWLWRSPELFHRWRLASPRCCQLRSCWNVQPVSEAHRLHQSVLLHWLDHISEPLSCLSCYPERLTIFLLICASQWDFFSRCAIPGDRFSKNATWSHWNKIKFLLGHLLFVYFTTFTNYIYCPLRHFDFLSCVNT